MEVTARLSNLRISPRKVRLVANLIRGLDVVRARTQLQFLVKRPALPVLKLLNSAAANAKHNFKLNPEDMYVAKILVDEGPSLRRSRPQSRGRVHPIKKKSSHVSLTLAEKKDRHQISRAANSGPRNGKRAEEKKKDALQAPAGKPAAQKKKEPQTRQSGEKKGRKRLTGIARRVFQKT